MKRKAAHASVHCSLLSFSTEHEEILPCHMKSKFLQLQSSSVHFKVMDIIVDKMPKPPLGSVIHRVTPERHLVRSCFSCDGLVRSEAFGTPYDDGWLDAGAHECFPVGGIFSSSQHWLKAALSRVQENSLWTSVEKSYANIPFFFKNPHSTKILHPYIMCLQ